MQELKHFEEEKAEYDRQCIEFEKARKDFEVRKKDLDEKEKIFNRIFSEKAVTLKQAVLEDRKLRKREQKFFTEDYDKVWYGKE